MPDQCAKWTIMVYISGDSVLDNFAIESLKKLRDNAGEGVTVQYLFDPNYEGSLPKSDIYDGQDKNTDKSLFPGTANKKSFLPKAVPGEKSGLDTADPEVLKAFIDFVIHSHQSPTQADDTNRHYGLVLWGHGTELLLDADQASKDKSDARFGSYLTPANLGLALKEAKLPVPELGKADLKPGGKAGSETVRKLDFIAFDACSMSMVEVAAEIQDYADFMIASQDDVPDQSFPYDKILSLLKSGVGTREVCTKIPQEYKNAFQDYFPAPGPALTNITLASLNLEKTRDITALLRDLAIELRRLALASEKARGAIIRARSAARGFVMGLYVDIYDFCQNLANEENLSQDLKAVCTKICKALALKPGNDLVLNNQTIEQGDVRCHGLSVYLPYLTTEESQKIEESLTIAGTGIATQLSKDGSTTNLHKSGSTTNLHKNGSTTNLHKSRAARIAETEKDLASLTRFNSETRWEDFIKHTWSYILAKEQPRDLDVHYSAQQCLLNLLSLCEVSSKSSGVAA